LLQQETDLHNPSPTGRPRPYGRLVVLLLIALAFAGAGKHLLDQRQNVSATAAGTITASVSPVTSQLGPSGLPLPRFVSLKSDKVNVRKGPSSDHGVAWVFHRKGMPVEIIAEFENWRKIRDSEGAEGWILQQMLSGKRSAIIMSYGHADGALLRDSPQNGAELVAKLNAGVTGLVTDCDGTWCAMEAQGYSGYIPQSRVWGVYPGETVD
jgi:SH3-like domain-containing protein